MAKRRVKGEGSVYRHGDYRVVGEHEYANGNRRYASGKTKAEVRRKLRGLLAARDERIAYDSENLTVGAYLGRWLLAAKGTVRQCTWERHEQVVRLHLGPTLGNVRLDKLTALQVQALYGRKLDEGLSPRRAASPSRRPEQAPGLAAGRWGRFSARGVVATGVPPLSGIVVPDVQALILPQRLLIFELVGGSVGGRLQRLQPVCEVRGGLRVL